LPVTVVIAQFKQIRATTTFFVHLRWHPNATPRPLRAACELAFDKAFSGYSSASVQARSTLLPMPPGKGLHRGILWDDQHQVVLTGTGDCSFIHTIVTHLRLTDPEARVFTVRDNDRNEKEIRVALMSEPMRGVVEQVDDDLE
jgi:hypothetical protein